MKVHICVIRELRFRNPKVDEYDTILITGLIDAIRHRLPIRVSIRCRAYRFPCRHRQYTLVLPHVNNPESRRGLLPFSAILRLRGGDRS